MLLDMAPMALDDNSGQTAHERHTRS